MSFQNPRLSEGSNLPCFGTDLISSAVAIMLNENRNTAVKAGKSCLYFWRTAYRNPPFHVLFLIFEN